jgi:hypothetical protein
MPGQGRKRIEDETPVVEGELTPSRPDEMDEPEGRERDDEQPVAMAADDEDADDAEDDEEDDDEDDEDDDDAGDDDVAVDEGAEDDR